MMVVLPDAATMSARWKERQAQIDQSLNTLNADAAASGVKYVRNPMNMSQMMTVQTGVKPVTQETITNEQVAAANTVLSRTDAASLGVPFGTVSGEAYGITPRTDTQIALGDRVKGAQISLNQIEKYSQKVNTSGPLTRGPVSLLHWLGGKTQLDQNAAMLMNQGGKLSNIVKVLGEAGALSEGDVKRGESLLPKITDTKAIATQKISDLRELLDAAAKKASPNEIQSFPDEASAVKAGIAPGTKVTIGGKLGTWQ